MIWEKLFNTISYETYSAASIPDKIKYILSILIPIMKPAVCDDDDHAHVVAGSTNMAILPERRLWNRVLVHVITRKKRS